MATAAKGLRQRCDIIWWARAQADFGCAIATLLEQHQRLHPADPLHHTHHLISRFFLSPGCYHHRVGNMRPGNPTFAVHHRKRLTNQ